MKLVMVAFCIVVAWTATPGEALSASWPKLENGSKRVQCVAALQIARAAFHSTAFVLYGPPVIPVEVRSVLVLGPDNLDISGGNGLKVDPAVFDKLTMDGKGGLRSLYWQKETVDGLRLVVHEVPMGWRGDQYSLFTISGEVTPDAYSDEGRDNDRKARSAPIVDDSWRPPLILQEAESGRPWVIDVGDAYDFLSDWRVYVASAGVMKRLCSVQFRPHVETAASLLPRPIRTLAKLLDHTIGSGVIDEGTLRQTAALRRAVEHMWANSALRPWASTEPYNTREEVDAGLREWSRTGPTYLAAYQSIQRQYPLAERSLATYYQARFHRPADEAQALAAYVLDQALRSHYTFHSEDHYNKSANPHPNPWQGE